MQQCPERVRLHCSELSASCHHHKNVLNICFKLALQLTGQRWAVRSAGPLAVPDAHRSNSPGALVEARCAAHNTPQHRGFEFTVLQRSRVRREVVLEAASHLGGGSEGGSPRWAEFLAPAAQACIFVAAHERRGGVFCARLRGRVGEARGPDTPGTVLGATETLGNTRCAHSCTAVALRRLWRAVFSAPC